MKKFRNPVSGTAKDITGTSKGATRRSGMYREARSMRANLTPQRTQQEVAEMLGVTRSAVELAELSALAKIILAFRKERSER